MSEGLATKLRLPRKRCHIPIGAINNTSTVAKYCTTATIRSRAGNYVRSLQFIIIPTISNFIPEELIDRKNLKIPRNIKLADPNFHRPAPVDMLLGAGPTLSMICVGQINLTTPNQPDLYLQKTRLGWIIGGSAPPAPSTSDRTGLTPPNDTLRNTPPSGNNICHASTVEDLPIKRSFSQNDPPTCSDAGHSSEVPSTCSDVCHTSTIEDLPSKRSFSQNDPPTCSDAGHSPEVPSTCSDACQALTTKELPTQYNFLQNDPPTCSDAGQPPEVPSTCSNVYYSSSSEDPPARRNVLSNPLLNHPLTCSDAATTTPGHSIASLQADLTRFWEIEEGPQVRRLSESDAACEEHFRRHTTRNSDGRYIVALPFNSKKPQLGESRTQAERRLLSLERKLQRDPDLKQQYHAVLQEYLDLGHLSEVKPQSSKPGFFLPHHGVIKSSSLTTKLRVVFDGSAVTSSGISLNDALHTGPKIQDDLLHILLRYRTYQYVLTGDIEKMYRQFLIREEDRAFQCILWRDTSGHLKKYHLNTVTFGLSAAPYLAIRCLKQLAQDEGHRFPKAAEILQRDFYVDDALTGAPTRKEALSMREELTQILQTAGLKIRQWASNDPYLLRDLPPDAINQQLYLGDSSTLKTLGIVWDATRDFIQYSVKTTTPPTRITKRYICSEVAKIYDPLGLLGPVIITAKLLLQKMWTMKVDWDESLPMDIHSEWTQYYAELPLLNNVVFKRNTIIKAATGIQLHGFCDASERAYGACIYLRTTDGKGQTQVSLLVAKSKVAPLKRQTIPRLELCGAVLLATLATTVRRVLGVDIKRMVLWTDSTIVLHWINRSPHTLQTFVANRIAEIQRLTDGTEWRHVGTSENPADLISRGQSPTEFLRPSNWKNGPDWLTKQETQWPTWTATPPDNLPEQKATICLVTTSIDTTMIEKHSSWRKLVRIIAYCLRWRYHNKGPLTATELHQSRNVIIRTSQRSAFRDEIDALSKNSNALLQNKLQRLNPFLDNDGLLRVGGRLKHAVLPFSQRHPIILPKSHTTTLIIEQEHRRQLHAGVQATLYAVRRTYWPIDGRSQVWNITRKCLRCCRARPPSIEYIMGHLPEARVTESRPFTHVGVDYCGPFQIKEKRHRNRKQIKAYVAVFVCFATKAVHLEVVSDLSSDAFIAALRRFISRRGVCTHLYSDNATNFTGANRIFKELQNLLRSEDHQGRVADFLASRSVQWHFIPPRSPHFGGIWEAAVKSFKHHFRRVASTVTFTYEDFYTLATEIEAILNSRPLTPISSDPNDLSVITPGHFLIGDPLTSLPEPNHNNLPSNRLSTWQHIIKMKQHFWKRWHQEYLNELTTRTKWTRGQHAIKDGTLVLIREDNIPSMQWPLGRVVQVHPGSDGVVRTATIKTAKGTLNRSVKRLAPLPSVSADTELPANPPASSPSPSPTSV